ncbi:MAG: ribonuclease III [Candidatus Nealsonbacteria bacterium]|nr:ribonuclease III [Candidatus Nealsonbacteria bacterium]
MKNFSKLERDLGVSFANKSLLTQAFCHRSYLNENQSLSLEHNERLEFLGDAVLELVVTEFLYGRYPKENEGELTAWRAALVNSERLAQAARELDFNEYLLLSRGETKDTGKARDFILANSFEAFIGSLYLDQGYAACQTFIKKHLLGKLPEIIRQGLFKDAKSQFQERAQEKTSITPAYQVLKETGPDHAKHFTIGVFLADKLIARGEGSSKQEGEEKAAKKALEIKKW